MLKAGIATEVITPMRGVSLAGYFNPRPNKGVLDELFVKVLLLEEDGVVTGFVNFDLCYVTSELVQDMRDAITKRGFKFADKLIFNATHTHTGPQINGLFNLKWNEEYIKMLVEKTALAVSLAHENLLPSEAFVTSVKKNPFAWNRRYFMKNGRVLTNPGKLNPDIVKPEGTVDKEIAIFAVKQEGRIAAMVVNIINHNDTVGGDLVSADWPGRMERTIQDALGYDVTVLGQVGCSGNINHFDVSSGECQTRYEEACKIGKGYGKIVAKALAKLAPLGPDAKLNVVTRTFEIPFQVISDEAAAEAEATLKRLGSISADEDMTSEGLATGNSFVTRFFAEQLVDYKAKCSGRKRDFKVVAIRLGNAVGFLALPGEPFTEIGMAIKKASPCKKNFVISNAMGKCGYVPMKECFERGGYEILPVVDGAPRQDTAERMIALGKEMLNS
ncbi:MAG: hypothetical protein A2X49_01585 [Lentisphaerae bacterium GWF2_52_8]|nr:MAG: hypothetical protein A2X49_01585 [Lentisphaerae bacterium GWF2_52_8]